MLLWRLAKIMPLARHPPASRGFGGGMIRAVAHRTVN